MIDWCLFSDFPQTWYTFESTHGFGELFLITGWSIVSVEIQQIYIYIIAKEMVH